MDKLTEIREIEAQLVTLAQAVKDAADEPLRAEALDRQHRELDERRMALRARLTPAEDLTLESGLV